MSQQGTPGWRLVQAGSGLDGGDRNHQGGESVDQNSGLYLSGAVQSKFQESFAAGASVYGQQPRGQYTAHPSFISEASSVYSHGARSSGPPQVTGQTLHDYQHPNIPYANGQQFDFHQIHAHEHAGTYQGLGQARQHVGSQEMYQNNELMSGVQPTPSHQLAAAQGHIQNIYQATPASSYQSSPHGATYQLLQNNDARQRAPALVSAGGNVSQATSSDAGASRPVPGPSQGQRLASASSRGESIATTSKKSNNGKDWKSIQGCPNLLVGVAPVPRQVVSAAGGIKPHVAGDNKNKTPLLSLRSDPLPCEVRRENIRPLAEELKVVMDDISGVKKHMKAGSLSATEIADFDERLKGLENRKMELEASKRMAIKGVAFKLNKNQAMDLPEGPAYDSESSSESSEDEGQKNRQLALQIMASTRPVDPVKGVEFDVMKIIYFSAEEKGISQDNEKDAIGVRVTTFGKYVTDLCTKAKASREAMAKASDKDADRLQAIYRDNLRLIAAALSTAMNITDVDTLSNIGRHLRLMAGLTSTLNRELQSKAYNTDTQRQILKFMSMATMMDLDIIGRLKLSGILEKYNEYFDEDMKALAKSILENAEAESAKNAQQKAGDAAAKQPVDEMPAKTAATKSAAPTTQGNSIAKPSLKAKPSQAVSAPATDSTRKGTQAYSGLQSARKLNTGNAKPSTAVPTKRSADTTDAEPRAAKKVNTEDNMASAAKPGPVLPSVKPPTNGARPRTGSTVLSRPRNPKPPSKAATSQQTSAPASSTIGDILASIEKVPEKPKRNEGPAKAPESEAAKRRAARGATRVRFKPDDELEEIRYFTHDSNEDQGRETSMMKDVRDNRQEGQVLKRAQRQSHGDEEDDDYTPSEYGLVDPVPTLKSNTTDYIPPVKRRETYATRGGERPVNSELTKLMKDYENRELMAVYPSYSDIPPTPGSPKVSNSAVTAPCTKPAIPADNPGATEYYMRSMQQDQYGPERTVRYASQRVDLAKSQAEQPEAQHQRTRERSPEMTQAQRDQRVLELLKSDAVKNWVDPDPYDPANPRIIEPPNTTDQKVLNAFHSIQSVVNQLREQPSPAATVAPGIQPNPASVQPGFAGYGQASVANSYLPQASVPQATPGTASHTVAPTQQQPAQAQQQGEQYYADMLRQIQALQTAQQPVVPQPAPAQPTPSADIARILAAINGTAMPAPAAPPAPPAPAVPAVPAPSPDANAAAWQAWVHNQAQSYAAAHSHGYGSQAQSSSQASFGQHQTPYGGQPQAQSQGQSYSHYSQHHESAQRDSSQSQGSYHRDNAELGNRKDAYRGGKEHKGINRALIGTKPCTFYAKGQCAKGDKCTFRHDQNDLQK